MKVDEIVARRKDKIQLFKDTVKHGKRTYRVPHMGNLWSWKIYDAGYKMSEAMFNYDIMLDAHRESFEKYNLDAYVELGLRNPLQVSAALGNNEYIIDDEKNSLNIFDQCFMMQEDYDELISDPLKFLWEKAIPRKSRLLIDKKENSDVFENFLKEYFKFNNYAKSVNELLNECGIPTMYDPTCLAGFLSGYEMLFNYIRGIKGVSIDMRRIPEKFMDAINVLDELFYVPSMNKYPLEKAGTSENACFDGMPAMLGHTIMNPKQFEKFYMPHLKRVCDFSEKYDKIFYMFCEGDSKLFFDYINEFPKNRFAVHCEQTNIFDMKKEVPNVTVVGGMTTDLLGSATPQQCVDYAKKLIDELAYDGGYIFSENKMISFSNECRADNYLAVREFVSNYRH